MRAYFHLTLWLALLLLAAPARAAETADFRDWTVSCEERAAGDGPNCVMFQRFVRASDGLAIGAVFISRPPQSAVPMISVLTPLGVDLKQGVAVKVDGGEQYPIAYLTCRPAGCEAIAGIGDVLLGSMRAGNAFRVAYIHMGQGQQTIPFSLQGFTAAFQALKALAGGSTP